MKSITGRYSRLCRTGQTKGMIAAVSVADFFLARGSEVVKLYNTVAARGLIPEIPRNKRRRMRSFKPYYQRPREPRTQLKSEDPRSRRTRRFKKQFITSTTPVTRIWHAKRFRMENIWASRIPTRVNDKGDRAIWKIAQRRALIHDRSYLDSWVPIGGVAMDTARLKEGGFLGCNFSHSQIRDGNFIASGLIIRDDRVVSIFQVLSNRVWTHPSARPEVELIMEDLGFVREDISMRFEIIGARSEEILRTVLGDAVDFEVQPGKVNRCGEMSVIARDNGRLIDIILDPGIDRRSTFEIWRRLVKACGSSRVIGVYDRHAVLSNQYGSRDFPFDFPSSRACARQTALRAKEMVESDQMRPKQCKMDTGRVESFYFPDWSRICNGSALPSESEVVAVTVLPTRKGLVQENAHVYVNNRLVGFVTTASSVGTRNSIAVVSKSLDFANLSNDRVEFQNPGSDHRYSAKLCVCKYSSTDSVLVGI